MRLLLFVSAFGILISIAVLIIILIKARKNDSAPKLRPYKHED